MMKNRPIAITAAACVLVGACSSNTTTRVVEPVPAATQRTVYPDGTYRDTAVVPAAPITTVVPARPATVYTTR